MINSIPGRAAGWLIIALILAAIAACGPGTHVDPPALGSAAPSFSADLLGGRPVQFPDDVEKRIVVLTFFSPG